MSNKISDNETLMKYWDYNKNISLPEESSIYSHNKFWWKCEKGHSYEQVAYSKVKGIGCPYCSGKLAIKGENDLCTLYPDIANEWDYEKNDKENYDIYTLPIGSQRKVWWICSNDHSYQRSIYDRLHGRGGCPICNNKQVLTGFNDIATTNPELLKEWDYEKNDKLGILPTNITNGTLTKIWWKCDKGHEWDAIARSRITGSGCPFCSNNKVLKGYNDLETTNPEIIKYWNYNKNKKLTPDMFSHGSTKKVWWICEKGHEWESNITSITRGNRCPICSNNQILKGFNDLQHVLPDVIQYWDYEKNNITPDMVFPKSNKKVWWKCDKGHSYEMSINAKTRANYHSCPICNKYKRTSVPEKIIYFYLSKCFKDVKENYHFDWLGQKELDIYIPEIMTAIEYDGARYHKEVDKDLEKDNFCYEHNIKLIRIREIGCTEYESSSIKIYSRQNYSQKYSNLTQCIEELFDKLNIICDINIDRDLQHVLKIIDIGNKENCLAITNPELLDEWDYSQNNKMNITPYNVTKGSNIKVWWICENGHSYSSTIAIKSNQHTGCPYCNGRKIKEGFNDLSTISPEIVNEWDYSKNKKTPEQTSSNDIRKYWWKCSRGHSYKQSVSSRVHQNTGCPYCSGHRVLKGFNDIETLFPNLKKEWDYEKNDKLGLYMSDFTKGNDTKVWWKCNKGHSYETKICVKINGTGCPYCCGKMVFKGFNDIATTHPELLKEWDYEKNELSPDTLTKGSHIKVYWKCEKGHSYKATISSRLRGTKCPYCNGNKILVGFNDLETTHPEVLVNWDYEKNGKNNITPNNISKGYSKKVWWKCEKGHSYQREVYSQRKGLAKCPICRKENK